jgi:predicted TIM-barrel fold metal-dependent hydrolase
MIIDFHVHIDESPDANMNGIPVKMGRKEILAGMAEAGIDRSVLLVMAPRGDMQQTRSRNDWLAGVCREEERFFGFGSVHPMDGEAALQEMTRCVAELGLKGFKLHPNTQDFDVGEPGLVDVFRQAAALDVPVLIDSYSPLDDQQPSKLLKSMLASPETKVCLAHVGLFRFVDFAIYGMLRQSTAIHVNAYFDLSGASTFFYNTPFHDQFRWVTEQMGPDHLLFGSDFPPTSQKEALEVVRNFGFPLDWMERITGGNAARLLKMSEDSNA